MQRKSGLVFLLVLSAVATAFGGWAAGCGGGESGSSSTSGGGVATECSTPEECDDANPCTDDACTDGACVHTDNTADLPDPTAGDCKKLTCEAGASVEAKDNTDIPDDNEDCTVDACSGGQASHTPKNNGSSCVIGDKSGTCEEGVCVVECSEADPACPDDNNPCTEDSCDIAAGQCVYDPLDGVPTPGAPTELDCKRNECVLGVDTVIIDDTEIPDDNNECTDDLCDEGVPSNPPTNIDTPCGANGDELCDGAGVCGECNDALLHCPFTPPCETPTCDNHVCGISFKILGDASPSQTPSDCLVNVCDGAGAVISQNDDLDVPDDGNDCTLDACSGGVGSHVNQPPLAACAAGQCDGNGVCKFSTGLACLLDTDCAGGMCVDGFCCDSTCSGPCDVCSAALGAIANGACTALPSGAAGNPTCAPYQCGGTSACAVSCAVNSNCAAGNYCSSNQCVPAQMDGFACAGPSDCASGFCVDGVCCNNACNGLCDACTAALKGTGADGVCGGVAAGTDPGNECATATCMTGQCNGASACQASVIGTACGSNLACSGTLQTNQDTCDGFGSCTDNGITNCGTYVCGPTSCKTSCTVDTDCSTGNFCSAGACIPKLTNGIACSGGSQCASGSCVDGVCCLSSSCSTCLACNVNGAGTCAAIPAGQQDTTAPNVCQGTQACDGAGICKSGNGVACANGTVCASGLCVDGVCCNSACSASCDACSIAAGGAVNGTCGVAAAGVQGSPSCAPYVCNGLSTGCPAGCAGDGDCASTDYCLSGVCTAKKVNGAACSGTNQCSSGFCTDGVCCNLSCTGLCTACTAAKKGAGSDGTCGNIVSGSDPDNECTSGLCTSGLCDGFGACGNLAAGTACGDLASCVGGLQTIADTCNSSGTCVDGGTISCGNYLCAGGSCPNSCVLDSDCIAAAYCSGGFCVPDCAVDANCLAGEYCDLSTNKCVAQLNQGAACTGNNQCSTTFCVDGFCCNSSCGALCQACSSAKKGSGPDGLCGNIVNLDPDNECPTLECTTGLCSNGQCGNQPFNFACGDVASCTNNLQTNADICNGLGTCTDKGTLSCNGFACNGTVCKTSCASDTDCITGYYCGGTTCKPKCNADTDCTSNEWCNPSNQHCQTKGINGTLCTGTNQCVSGFCADGVCCTSACSSLCQACTAAKKGSGSDGTCGNIQNLDPDNECPNIECYTGNCNAGVCAFSAFNTSCGDALSCAPGVQTNQDICSGTGTCTDKGTTSCGGYACNGSTCGTSCTSDANCLSAYYCETANSTCLAKCNLDTDCFPNQWCNTANQHCVAKSANGGTCTAGNQCSSSQCVDGYCCNNSCTGACRSCGLAGTLGTCSLITSGTDNNPANVCNGVNTCNSSGVCKLAAGQSCINATQCASNVCTGGICQ